MKTRATPHVSRSIRMIEGILVILALGNASAADIYVASTGSSTAPYDAWTNAFTSVQAAFDHAAANPGVTNIYLKGQTFAAAADGTKVYALAGRSDLAIRGGYQADPGNPVLPGPRDPVRWPTALARSGTTPQGRVLSLSGLSNVAFEQIVIRSGSYGLGGGVNIGTSTGVLFDSCTISNNLAYFNRYNAIGGGLYITGSSVTMTNCTVAGNATGSPQDTCYGWGGGAYIGNLGFLSVVDSAFSGNHAYATKNAVAYGGAFYVALGGALECRECLIVDNKATSSTAGSRQGRGGAVYNNGGALRLRNVLLARNTTDIVASSSSGGISMLGASATTWLDNCTVIDNDAGKTGATGIRYEAGLIAITNSIVWGHDADLMGLPADALGTLTGVWHSDIGDGQNAGMQGCHSIDPQFADTLFYHLKSTAGHYAGGAFGGGSWATAAADSPVIDRGNPASAFSRETAPNGSRVNMGAYGNTEVASRSPAISATMPAVSNSGALYCGHTTAHLRGVITDGGVELPEVAFHYWVSGTTVTSTVPVGMQPEGALDFNVAGFVAGTSYEYRISAANSAGTAWSGVAAFNTLPANTTLYVSSSGDNSDGTTWAKAFTDLLSAVALSDSGDTIRIKGETFTAAPGFGLPYVFRIASKSNLRIEGGYEAAGATPGARDPGQWPTTLARNTSAANASVLRLESLSNVTLDGLTIRDGRYSPGGGVHITGGSGIVFSNCRLTENRADGGLGGALYLTGTSVTLTNCVVDANLANRGNDITEAYGGAAYLDAGSTLAVWHSTIAQNKADGARTRASRGGAFYLNAATSELHVRESVLTNNAATTEWAGGIGRGGAICNNGGKVLMRNVLLARNLTALTATDPSGGIYSGGTAPKVFLENCTVADNDAGKAGSVGLRCGAGVFAVTNSIVWGHVTDLANFTLAEVAYSDIGDGQNNGVQGCFSAEPSFLDTLHYHLKSTVGCYSGGAFSGGTWTTSDADSLAIDLGDPASGYSREPEPNGSRINLGAYGNTGVASKTADIEVNPPAVVNSGAILWGHGTAVLRGEVTDDGGQYPDITVFYWLDGGSVTSSVMAGMQGGPFSAQPTGLDAGANYLYRFSAENDGGLVWSGTSAFTTLPDNAAICVSTNGSNTAGTTWATAYTNLQEAIDLAAPGDTIHVAGQTFGGEPGFGEDYIYLLDGQRDLVIQGGYEAAGATPGACDPVTWPTVIQRDAGSAHVLNIVSVSNVVLRSLTIQGGNQTQGGGVYASGSRAVTFDDCRIVDNIVPEYDGLGVGGGVYLENSTVSLTWSLVANNSISPGGHDNYRGHGGGIYVADQGSLSVRNSTIANNTAWGDQKNVSIPTQGSDGGGIYIAAGGVLDMSESVMTNNYARKGGNGTGWTRGGAIANVGGTAKLRNVLVARNLTQPTSVDPSSGIYASGTTAIQSSTIASNDTGKVDSIGVRYGVGTLSVTNSIVWGHAAGDLSNLPVDGSGHLLDVGWSLFNDAAMDGISGCRSADPLFVSDNDFRLQDGTGGSEISPAVDAGLTLPWMRPAADLAGGKRVHGASVDMGAYEVPAPGATIIIVR